jgi:hypothetical protein
LKESLSTSEFGQVNGPIVLFDNNQESGHRGSNNLDGTFRVNRVYRRGVHRVRIFFKQFGSSDTFVGIISQSNMHQLSIQSPEFSSGWFFRDGMVTHNDKERPENLKM